MIDILKKYPKNKIPPAGLYSKLVEMTGLRNSWTIKQWINFLGSKENERGIN